MKSRESFNFVTNFFANRTRDAERKKLDAHIRELIKERFTVVQREFLSLTSLASAGEEI